MEKDVKKRKNTKKVVKKVTVPKKKVDTKKKTSKKPTNTVKPKKETKAKKAVKKTNKVDKKPVTKQEKIDKKTKKIEEIVAKKEKELKRKEEIAKRRKIALVTGASSGIGKEISISLAKRGFDIIAVARDKKKLNEFKRELEDEYENVKVYVKDLDVTNRAGVIELYKYVKREFKHITVLVNNAGFGKFGYFTDTKLDDETKMIDTNVVALHMLTKLFLKEFVKDDYGYILNVASIAGFMPGPLMATYYATKNYVVRLTQAIRYELKKQKSNVVISCLCPGPTKSNFFKVADVKFLIKEADTHLVAEAGVNRMFKKKLLIFPEFSIRCAKSLAKVLPDNLVARYCYKVQKKKTDDK